MTSQSPASGSTPTQAYADAWSSIAVMVAQEGMSWSGRERNRLFRNLDGHHFVDVSFALGGDFIEDARAVASLDWDGDGRQDLLVKNRNAPRLRLLHNRSATGSHWLQVSLVGGEGVNLDAIGSEVTIRTANGLHRQVLLAGDGFLCQSSKTMNFGLGADDVILGLEVRWPDGSREPFLQEGATLGADRHVRLVAGAGLRELPTPAKVALTPAPNVASQTGDVDRIPLVTKLPLAELPLPSFEHPNRRVRDLAGHPVLINFWSTTCAACLEEFADFHDNRRMLRKQGVQVVTMVTDGLERHERALDILKGVGLAEGAGWADQRVEASLRILVEEVLNRTIDMPLPVSLLLDSQGQLVEIHIGRLRMGALKRDLQLLRRMDPRSPDGSALAFGRRLAFRDRDYEQMAEKFDAAKLPEVAAYYRSLVGRFTPPGR